MLAPQPFFVPRGTPISVYLRLQLLSRLGHQVTLLTYHLGQEIAVPGVRVYRIPYFRFISQVKIGPSWAKLFLDAMLLALAVKHLLTAQYQVIHTHEEAAMMGMLLAPLFRVAHIYDMHSSLPRQFKNFQFGNRWLLVKAFELLERWVLRTCQAVIVVGADLEQIVRRIKPDARLLRMENLPVQAYGIDHSPDALAAVRARLPLAKRLCIVYAGTFEPYQGLDLLLNSAKLVALREPEALFIWLGGRPDQVRYWQDQVAASDLHNHVLLLGTVPLAESLAYLETADILVSPRRDGTSVPLKIYTYLQAGKPIVATHSFAHTQVLSASTAVLVEPTPEGLAAGILRLAGDPALRRALGEQARALALEKFNVAEHLDKLADLYRPFGVAAGRVPANPSAT